MIVDVSTHEQTTLDGECGRVWLRVPASGASTWTYAEAGCVGGSRVVAATLRAFAATTATAIDAEHTRLCAEARAEWARRSVPYTTATGGAGRAIAQQTAPNLRAYLGPWQYLDALGHDVTTRLTDAEKAMARGRR